MKIIIAGSRSLEPNSVKQVVAARKQGKVTDDDVLRVKIESYSRYFPFLDRVGREYLPVHIVVSGKAAGGDDIGETWAILRGLPIQPMPAEWQKYGKSAGIRRNIDMAECSEGAIVLHDGVSRGSNHMREYMEKIGKPVLVALIQEGTVVSHKVIGLQLQEVLI